MSLSLEGECLWQDWLQTSKQGGKIFSFFFCFTAHAKTTVRNSEKKINYRKAGT